VKPVVLILMTASPLKDWQSFLKVKTTDLIRHPKKRQPNLQII
jgi:hypothetical protein